MPAMVAANWKMHKTIHEARETAQRLSRLVPNPACDVAIFPPFTALEATRLALDIPGAAIGGQDVYPEKEGAFTGEISPGMLLDTGCTWVLAGHSERRHILHEPDALIGKKAAFAMHCGLGVILCIGETEAERDAGQLEAVLARQLAAGLADISSQDAPECVIAYEPVWAIGTGKSATETDIVDAHGLVRELLTKLRGKGAADMRILYGGSVKPNNARSILCLDNVGGLLVGGASLQAESFAAIIEAASAEVERDARGRS